jgi:hypothetical protein
VKKDPEIFLTHILESIQLVEGYLKKVSQAKFMKDPSLQDAVTRRIEIIGPLSKLGFVDFRDYFGLFSIVFAGVISTLVYDPRENNRKVGSKEPENRQNLISKEVHCSME